MQIYSMKFQNASSVGPWRFMRKQYGVRLGLWDSKPILFWFYLLIYLFLSIYISIIHLTKKVAYGGRISIYSPDHGLLSCSLILAIASITVEVDPPNHDGFWSWPMQFIWTSNLNEYSKYLGSVLVYSMLEF
jgi:hypothetical protein